MLQVTEALRVWSANGATLFLIVLLAEGFGGGCDWISQLGCCAFGAPKAQRPRINSAAMGRAPIVIFAAVEAEAKAIARAMKLGPDRRRRIRETGVELYTIGIGGKRLPAWEISRERTSCIIMAGVAGALNPELGLGDVIIDGWPEDCAEPSMDPRYRYRRGRIHTLSKICAVPQEKR